MKLDELGIKNKSIFVWEYYNKQCYAVKFIAYAVIPDKTNQFKLYSAFTAAELLDIIPYYIDTKTDEPFNNFRISISKGVIFDEEANKMVLNYLINYLCDTTETAGEKAFLTRNLFHHTCYDYNLANAAAKVLINLLESGFISTPLPGVLQDG